MDKRVSLGKLYTAQEETRLLQNAYSDSDWLVTDRQQCLISNPK